MKRSLALMVLAALAIACSGESGAPGRAPSRPTDTMTPVDAALVRAAAPKRSRTPAAFSPGRRTPENFATAQAHEGTVTRLAVAPDGSFLISAGYDDREVERWAIVDSGLAPMGGVRLPDRPTSLALTPDAAAAIVADAYDHVRVLPLVETSFGPVETLAGKGHSIDEVAVSPGGRLLATSSWEKTLEVWDLAARRRLHVEESHAGLRQLAFSPSGDRLAVGHASGAAFTIWELESGNGWLCRVGQAAVESDVLGLAFDPAGDRVAVVLNETTIAIWDARERKEKTNWFVADKPAWCVAFSPDGRVLATGHTDGWIRLWDAATGELAGACVGHEKSVRSLAFLPSGDVLASGGEDGTIRLWR